MDGELNRKTGRQTERETERHRHLDVYASGRSVRAHNKNTMLGSGAEGAGFLYEIAVCAGQPAQPVNHGHLGAASGARVDDGELHCAP